MRHHVCLGFNYEHQDRLGFQALAALHVMSFSDAPAGSPTGDAAPGPFRLSHANQDFQLVRLWHACKGQSKQTTIKPGDDIAKFMAKWGRAHHARDSLLKVSVLRCFSFLRSSADVADALHQLSQYDDFADVPVSLNLGSGFRYHGGPVSRLLVILHNQCTDVAVDHSSRDHWCIDRRGYPLPGSSAKELLIWSRAASPCG